MREVVEAQRYAFFAELPVSVTIRRDRLRRAQALLEQNADALCDAIANDHEDQSRSSAMLTDLKPAIAALQHAARNVGMWMLGTSGAKRITRIFQGDDYIDYQPIGVVGLAAPATLAIHQSMSLLASILAAGNRAVIRFSPSTPATGRLFADLASRYFDPLELTVAPEEAADFFSLPFDKVAISGREDEVAGRAPEEVAVAVERSGKSPVIFGRSANFAASAAKVIESKLARSGRVPLAPDYLLVPAEHEEEVANWLWRSAVHLHPRMSRKVDVDMPMSEAEWNRLTRLIDDARARGGEIVVADHPSQASNGIRSMPLHIIRHASEDMLVMQGEISGPILPLRNYQTIADAIRDIHRHAPPIAIYYFGRDRAERREVQARTISSAIALGGTIAAEGAFQPSGSGLTVNGGHGAAGFRSFSRARHVYRGPMLDLSRWAAGASVAAPALP